MLLKDRIFEDLTQAMKKSRKDELRVLRSLKARILEKEISERKDGEAELSDEQIVEVLMKAAKQRKESIDQFEAGDRKDLADIEREELKIIEHYLPEMMSKEEVRSEVRKKISEIGASSMADMGKVMGALMGSLKGKADGALISNVVKEELS